MGGREWGLLEQLRASYRILHVLWPFCGRSDLKWSAPETVWQRKGKSVRQEMDNFLKGCWVWPFALGLVARFICQNFIWNLFTPRVSSYISSSWCCFWSATAFTHYHLCRSPSWKSWLFCQAMREQTERERGVTERKQCMLVYVLTAGCWVLSPLCFTLPPSLLPSPNLHRTERSMCRRTVNVPSFVSVCSGGFPEKPHEGEPALFAVCTCVSMHVCVSTLRCWTGKVAASAPPPRWDDVVSRGLRSREGDEGPELLGVGDGPLPLPFGLPE